jgi:hypothetical protein
MRRMLLEWAHLGLQVKERHTDLIRDEQNKTCLHLQSPDPKNLLNVVSKSLSSNRD